MNRKLLIVLAITIILAVLIVPASTSAQDEKLLTPAEKSFTLLLASKIARIRGFVAEHRAWADKWKDSSLLFRLIATPKVSIPYPSNLVFEGCSFGTNGPDTMGDITDLWDTEICNEIGFISQSSHYCPR